MAECLECGATVAPGEYFCGGCGSKQLDVSKVEATKVGEVKLQSAAIPAAASEAPESERASNQRTEVVRQTGELDSNAAGEGQPLEKPSVVVMADSKPISPDSLGGSSTGNVDLLKTSNAAHKGTTGGHQPTVKQLDPGTVLNGRYEIARRIGGGGMGAVYLAKDRNLGDASRAVKEMVEAHLDPL